MPSILAELQPSSLRRTRPVTLSSNHKSVFQNHPDKIHLFALPQLKITYFNNTLDTPGIVLPVTFQKNWDNLNMVEWNCVFDLVAVVLVGQLISTTNMVHEPYLHKAVLSCMSSLLFFFTLYSLTRQQTNNRYFP